MFLRYDSTFCGLLSAIAWCFRNQVHPDGFLGETDEQPLLDSYQIACEKNIHHLFQRHLEERLGSEAGRSVLDTVFHAFLSEERDIASQIWRYLDHALCWLQDPAPRLYEPAVAAVVGAARRVGGQAHQYLGLLRFRETEPSFFLADFEPDCHVLPLILPHFADRLADQNFVIRDLRRQLAALHLRDGKIRLYMLAGKPDQQPAVLPAAAWPVLPTGQQNSRRTEISPRREGGSIDSISDHEPFEDLWCMYLKHLTIPERCNPALQQANMPKKYWKYLTENPLENRKRSRS